MEVESYYFGKHLRAYRRCGGFESVVVTFDHWRNDRNGFPDPVSGRSFLDRSYDIIRIDSSRNDWFLNDDLSEVLDKTADLVHGYRNVVFLGFSMGAFGALALAKNTAPKRLIVASPSFPPNPQKTAQILPGYCEKDAVETRAFIHYDSLNKKDAAAAKRYARAATETKLIDFAGGGHPATNRLANEGRYRHALDHWLSDNICVQSLLRLHGEVSGDGKCREMSPLCTEHAHYPQGPSPTRSERRKSTMPRRSTAALIGRISELKRQALLRL